MVAGAVAWQPYIMGLREDHAVRDAHLVQAVVVSLVHGEADPVRVLALDDDLRGGDFVPFQELYYVSELIKFHIILPLR